MKNIISIMLIAAFGVMLVFTGCKEEEYTPEPLPMVTVSGQVLTELDLTNAVAERVPAGTTIIFRINARDLVAVPIVGYAYQTLQYETTVGADGTFTIQLPTVNFNAVPVEVVLNPFVKEQTIAADNKKEMVFESSSNYNFTTTEGEDYYKVYVYDVFTIYEY
ncbi:MAG: hypothetical protein PHY85_07165 [Bacteroidales bacterium]|nr:hypothetical protein [Bacteroidales bacterium]